MRRAGIARLVAVAACLWLAFLGVVLVDAQAADRDAGTLIAVTAPWTDRDGLRLAAQSDGRLVAPGWGGLTWAVHSDDDGFAGRLRAAGALAVFYPAGLLGCLGPD